MSNKPEPKLVDRIRGATAERSAVRWMICEGALPETGRRGRP